MGGFQISTVFLRNRLLHLYCEKVFVRCKVTFVGFLTYNYEGEKVEVEDQRNV